MGAAVEIDEVVARSARLCCDGVVDHAVMVWLISGFACA